MASLASSCDFAVLRAWTLLKTRATRRERAAMITGQRDQSTRASRPRRRANLDSGAVNGISRLVAHSYLGHPMGAEYRLADLPRGQIRILLT